VGSIEVLVERLQRVVLAMTADPARRLSSVDVLGVGERAQLEGWGNRAALMSPVVQLGVSVSIPAVFAAQVARAPEAVALSFEGESLTYRQLDEASNRLAHFLVGQGVVSGDRVAVLLPRCAEAIVAIVAVLKAGASYVPIDPGQPGARMQFMLADAGPVAVVTTAELAERVQGYELAVIDVDDGRIDTQPGTAVAVGVAPDDVAYLIYTSGTTGVPKGVAVSHRNVTRLLETLDADLELSGQVWSQCHSLAFDYSVWEIWGAL
ncbi:AMP-binding protein, partial [Mycobacterium sp. 852002-51971_SCH5477799-a]|uniref:AMP-binding protein n=1 Tax=Mycobacterium sp. 852002-51971_SCH5477799-a TaxID=1834106 RepID=UPI0012E80E83